LKRFRNVRRLCPICQSNDDNEIRHTLYDDRYGYPDNFLLLKCNKCGHKYLEKTLIPEQITTLYTNYYPRSTFRVENYRPHKKRKGLTAWLSGEKGGAYQWVPKRVKVLDIGCGSGEAIGYHKSRGCDVYGVETDENIKCIVEKYGFNVHIGMFDPKMYEHEYFDYVTMDQVIEHISDPIETLRGVASILKDGGSVILSTPNSNGWGANLLGRRWINWHVPYHQNFFSKKSIEIAALKAGMRLERSMTLTSSEWLKYQWIHLLLFPRMGEPSLFWSRAKREVNNKTRIKAFYFAATFAMILHLLKLNHVITRFWDMMDFGDNYLFFMIK